MQNRFDIKSLFTKRPKVLGLVGVTTLVASFLLWYHSRSSKDSQKNGNEADKGLQLIKEPPGLKNYGTTCFINSTLQSMASMPSFLKFVLKLSSMSKNPESYNAQITFMLKEILVYLNSRSTGPMHPMDFIKLLNSKSEFSLHQEQQDCHEFLKMLMNILDSELKANAVDLSQSLNPMIMENRKLTNPFVGYHAQILKCMTCSRKYHTKVESFNDISLSISSQKINSLEDALDHYVKPEYLSDVECFECTLMSLIKRKEDKSQMVPTLVQDKELQKQYQQDFKAQIEYLKGMKHKSLQEIEDMIFELGLFIGKQASMYKDPERARSMLTQEPRKVKSTMEKFIRFARLPKILCIHVQRVYYNNMGQMCKLDKHIDFKESLKFQKWLEPKIFNEDSLTEFDLSAVIRHYGTDSFGHYITFRRAWHQNEIDIQEKKGKFSKSIWSFTSDDDTFIVNKEEVLKAPAYMLFYERKSKQQVTNSKMAKQI